MMMMMMMIRKVGSYIHTICLRSPRRPLLLALTLLLIVCGSILLLPNIFHRNVQQHYQQKLIQNDLQTLQQQQQQQQHQKHKQQQQHEQIHYWYERAVRSLTVSKLNAAVFEEHHEALLYWYAAVERGLLPHANNFLIHVDGHSDGAVPGYHDAMFEFNRPQTAAQIHTLMLRNDVFVLAAAYKGLINTFVWVYPNWMTISAEGQSMYRKGAVISLGHYTDEKHQKGNCACHNSLESECNFADKIGFPIEDFKGDCKPVRNISAYFMTAAMAKSVIPTILHELPTNSKVILDIDEDFYGVMRGSDLLNGTDFDSITDFNHILHEIFVINCVNDEVQADRLLKRLLEIVKTTCFAEGRGLRHCKGIGRESIYLQLKTHHSHLLTFSDGFVLNKKMVHTLLTSIKHLFTYSDIDTLIRVGFCLGSSPMTFELKTSYRFFMGYRRIAVCHGRNEPDTQNQIMIPQSSELPFINRQLESVTSLVPEERIGVVTICRSNRDGYVPRHLQPKIEDLVLGTLDNSYGNIHVVYDSSLMLHLNTSIHQPFV